jgi:hypothetical protein
MTKIVGLIKPLEEAQQLYVFIDDEQVDYVVTNIDKLTDTIYKLVELYNVEQLDLVGSNTFNKHIGDTIKTFELKDYNKSDLIINYI